MKNKKRMLLSMLTATGGVLMMAFGVYRGELEEVFTKAIRICLECIGIG